MECTMRRGTHFMSSKNGAQAAITSQCDIDLSQGLASSQKQRIEQTSLERGSETQMRQSTCTEARMASRETRTSDRCPPTSYIRRSRAIPPEYPNRVGVSVSRGGYNLFSPSLMVNRCSDTPRVFSLARRISSAK